MEENRQAETLKQLVKNRKLDIVNWLRVDAKFILRRAHTAGVITDTDYVQLKSIRDTDEANNELIDKVYFKGEETCEKFLFVCADPEVKQQYPDFGKWITSVTGGRGQSVVSDAVPVTDDEDYYPMNSRPRGLCLIINNFKFTNPLYKQRDGTEKDAVDLRRVFEQLHFVVEEQRDVPCHDMRTALREYAKLDHSRYDAVVVCVLSHGVQGGVMGVDGNAMSIKDIYRPFTHCRSLAGKPKLFFIQACQGSKFHRGLSLQEGGPQQQLDEDFEEDAYNPLVTKTSTANEADILVGMATVDEFKTFRHTKTGSIYIQALCRALESRCPKKEDLLTILTRVNNEVSKGDYNTFTQMPQPKYTLTKKLVLTVD